MLETSYYYSVVVSLAWRARMKGGVGASASGGKVWVRIEVASSGGGNGDGRRERVERVVSRAAVTAGVRIRRFA